MGKTTLYTLQPIFLRLQQGVKGDWRSLWSLWTHRWETASLYDRSYPRHQPA